MQMKTHSSEKTKNPELDPATVINVNAKLNTELDNKDDEESTTCLPKKENRNSNQKQQSIQKHQAFQQHYVTPKYAFNQNNFYENAIFSYVNNLSEDHLYAMDPRQFYQVTSAQPFVSSNQVKGLKKHSKGQSQVSLADDNHIEYSKKERPSSTSKTNIYIRGLNEDTTDKDLHDMCHKFGEIKSTKAIIEKQTNKCKGYGFVDYKSPDDALKALSEMKKEQKDVQLAKQREQDPTNLYFANLPGDIDEKCLTELLQKKFNATVNSTRIMRERTGNSKGVGFARVDFKDTCEKIIKELNGHSFPDHEDKTKILLVKLADSGANFKSTKSFKITQSNKLSNDSSNPSNRFMNTNGMSQFVDPAINNGYPVTMYENPQLIPNASYMHLFPHHQLQPATHNQQYLSTTNPSITRSPQIHQNQQPTNHPTQQPNNINSNVPNSIYYTNQAILPSSHHHHSVIPTAIHIPGMPYVLLPHNSQHQPGPGHYQLTMPQQQPTTSVAYDTNKNSTPESAAYGMNLPVNNNNRAASVISNSTGSASTNQYNEVVNQSNQFVAPNSGHITVSAVHGQNQQYQYQQ